MTLKTDITDDEAMFFDTDELAVEATYFPTKGEPIDCNVILNENAIGVVSEQYGENEQLECTIDIPKSVQKIIGVIKKDERILIKKTKTEWRVVSVQNIDEISATVYCVRKHIYKVKA